MNRLVRHYKTPIGKKAVVAVTGAILFGFVVLHMLGNLKAFVPTPPGGAPDLDIYARFLRTMGEPAIPYTGALWAMRVVLIVSLALHIATVILLTRDNRAARPVAYARYSPAEASIAARAMFVTGGLLLGFIVVHVLQITTGTLRFSQWSPETVYANLYHAFHVWWVVALYVAAMAVLGLHLEHGAWSLFQSLGLDSPDRNRLLRGFATTMAVALFVGFSSVPVLFIFDVLPPPPADESGADRALEYRTQASVQVVRVRVPEPAKRRFISSSAVESVA